MKRYKLLTQDGYATFNFLKDEVYDETAKSTMGITVRNLADSYPADWQLVEEKQEKRPLPIQITPFMTYVILLTMMVLYIYAGLAEINWPLIPATMMGFYLLFKIERNGRSN